MHPRELEEFRDKIAMPRMLKLYENIHFSEGTCYIDEMEISVFDGRSCGVDSLCSASGYVYEDGAVKEYSFSEYDVNVSDFVAAHKNCTFITDGKLKLCNELDEIEIDTVIRNLDFCSKLFAYLEPTKDLHLESASLAFEKMKYLFQNAPKPQLDQKIQDASSRTQPASKNIEKDYEPYF